jgi:peptidoglycan/xylan/chitin deacetylase (PgdA/CDA1 family)
MARWRVLCYHTVEPPEVRSFERQLRGFERNGYDFCSLTEGAERRLQPARRDWLTVSFDDADRTVADNAQPVLDDRGVKAILYLNSDYVLKGKSYRDTPSRPSLTWDQLGRWTDRGHEVGSHTHTHADLRFCSPEQLREEMEQSREVIRRHLGVVPVHVSYPWGQHGPAVRDYLRNSGHWASAATIHRGWNVASTDPFQLRRDLVSPAWGRAKVWLRVEFAGSGPVYRLHHSARRLLGMLPRRGGAAESPPTA